MKRLCFVVALPAALFAATPLFAQGPRKAPAPGFKPQAPKLTTGDVERLIKVMPELAKESGQLTSDPSKTMRPGMDGQLPIDDLHKVEGMLKKHGYTFTEFLTQLTALVSTYLALEPEAFDKQLPSEKSPEVQRVLNNPDVPQKDKDELKKQIAEAHKNKELIRTQVTAFATEENKRVVRPLLARVRRALQQAEMAAVKARKAKK